MRRHRAAFIGFIFADLFMLLVAQGPIWVTPKNTSLFLNSSRSDVCDRVTNLNATSSTGDKVTYTIVSQDPYLGFKVMPDQNGLEYVLQCSAVQKDDETYIVVVRANYTSGSSNFTDLTLNITFAKSEPDKDECAADPCVNGGECTDLIDGYNCTCKPGFNGSNCEINSGECAADPCENGGECTNLIDGYNCTCRPGFNGTNCEINIDECADDPCKNGECTDLMDGYNCTCRPGFYGTNCEKIDECATVPCKNEGKCTNLDNGYRCTCKQGFAGTTCETNIDECATVPCKNGGECTDLNNGYRCTCKQGFAGTTCETIDGGFNQWSDWSVCSVTCGQGIQTRNRQCNNPVPAGGGLNCNGDYEERQQCNRNECRVNPIGLCECHTDNYWDGKACVAKASICSDSCDTSALVVMVVLLSIVAVTLVIYAVYLKLKMNRNSGQLGIVSKETSVRTKSQEPKFVSVAYVENETHPDGQLKIRAQREDAGTPDETDLDEHINETNATEDKNHDTLPLVQSEIQGMHEDVITQEESNLNEESKNRSKDDAQNPRNANGAFADDGKHPEGQSEIQEQHQDVGTQEITDQDEITETFNASKDEGNTGVGENTEDKDKEEKNNVPDETDIRNETQNESNKSATDDKDNKESKSESSETSDEDK